MHSYTKGNVNIFFVYRGILIFSFVFSFILGAIKYHSFTRLFEVFNLLFAGMPFLVTYIIYVLFVKYMWKWKLINRFINVPNLNGIYEGILKSSFDGFLKELKFTLKIKQDFENISIVMEMKEQTSKSYSINAYIEKKNDEILLIYTYQNDPFDKTSPTLTEHKGTTILRFNSDLKTFKGHYFTDKRPINSKKAICNYGSLEGRKIDYIP